MCEVSSSPVSSHNADIKPSIQIVSINIMKQN